MFKKMGSLGHGVGIFFDVQGRQLVTQRTCTLEGGIGCRCHVMSGLVAWVVLVPRGLFHEDGDALKIDQSLHCIVNGAGQAACWVRVLQVLYCGRIVYIYIDSFQVVFRLNFSNAPTE